LENISMSKRKRNNKAVATADAFSNPAARLGFGTMDLMQGTAYPLTRMSQNYQLLTSLYRDNWIVQNIVTTIPNDIIRKWYDLKTSIDPKYLDTFNRQERKTGVRDKLKQGMYWGRLYGGAAGLILIKGQEDLSQPLDLDSVLPGSFQGLMIVDRWNGIYPDMGTVTDPADPDFGLPEYYTIRDEERDVLVARVHHSRLIRFIGRDLPWLEQVAEQYWGESEIEAIYNEIVKRDNSSANIASLMFRANVNYMEADGLDQLLSTGNAEMQRRFWNTMAAQSYLESNFGMRILNKGDAIHNTQYTFTGIADAYDRIMMDVAGAARTPVTKLFGRSPGGLNATGESDMRNYYDYIDGLRETMFRPIIERLLPVMALSAWGVIPDDLEVDFPEMETADPKELAEITERKTTAIIAAYQADLIDASTAMQELQAASESTGVFGKIKDEDIEAAKGKTFSSTQQMADPMSGIFNVPMEEEPGVE
jgi:phage-related protein (TIGR01555 family)